ncbi:MAG: hypothetical protein JNK46_02320 [Methylobacteriaceae bacterium]|nr:hypothetical protein [Methylobacteriaceae bacterium]
MAAGCSISIPMISGQGDEEIVTGSIAPVTVPESPLGEFLDPVEQTAALAALGAALDPQASGAAVAWGAPGARRRGQVQPVGAATPDGDHICRRFEASGVGVAGAFRATGEACRDKRGEWTVREMRSRQKA